MRKSQQSKTSIKMMDLDFEKSYGLIPAIIQDANTDKVLMLGYMDDKALKKTIKEGQVTFYSRSKERLWTKGETSGNFLKVVEVIPDCDKDAILVKVIPDGPVCHTGKDTCFGEKNNSDYAFLRKLENTIKERRKNPVKGSHTSKLFERGVNKIAQKVGEEAVEMIIEAKDNDKTLFINECADLLYHVMVLLEAKDASLKEVVKVLKGRGKVRK
ncbi:MAG: bifunctional phosphoribosyl-AMP cyclohydrolase/phosphoribosyl-ATP diphosphatase HisIE [Bacteroidia bacterium]|nr:bifunctional phosphoribosyl-AMP cyclohydrolase/phosphoribosyl-ATP diphosphatase HisIE [Bacteroidia bacterium]